MNKVYFKNYAKTLVVIATFLYGGNEAICSPENSKISEGEFLSTKAWPKFDELSGPGTVKGVITDTEGEPLIGANLQVKGTSKGTTTDIDGNYILELEPGTHEIMVSYVGFQAKTQSVIVSEGQTITLNFKMASSMALDELVVVGSRSKPRTILSSPVPIDNISTESLKGTGQNSLDQQLMFSVPSYTATEQPISDATAHFNPADLRGLMSSRTLVLVNGKRKNASALVYTLTSPGRGEVGVDMKAIPTSAIERVEVLRDGAAAQYGSDAIAGVLNIVMKKHADPFANINYGITSKGDGRRVQMESGMGFNLNDKGYANFSINYFDQKRTDRTGKIEYEAEKSIFGPYFEEYLESDEGKGWLDRNPAGGFQVGLPDLTVANFAYNMGFTVDEENEGEIYSFGSLASRGGSSPQYARTPYWMEDDIFHFDSIYPGAEFFLAEMAPKILDFTSAIGYRTKFNDWNFDISSTQGGNFLHYYILGSFNMDMGSSSPSDFYNGAHFFKHVVNNIDISRGFEVGNLESFTLAMGGEYRMENYVSKKGDEASYYKSGSQSFFGITPESEFNQTRSNTGFYTELESDITRTFLLGMAGRFEDYSDFGTNFSWKANSRLLLLEDKLSLRGAISNGFRAPAMHQIHFTAITTSIEDGKIQNQGTIANSSPLLRFIEVPKLEPETSFNIGIGGAMKITNNISATLDLYQIDVNNRVILSGQLVKPKDENGEVIEDSEVTKVLTRFGVDNAQFFMNAVDTRTSGIDLVFDVRNIDVAGNMLNLSLAANFNRTKITNVNLPEFFKRNKLEDDLFERTDRSRIETFRPNKKIIGNASYDIGEKFTVGLTGMFYGAVKWKHAKNPENDRTYGGKFLADANFSYKFNDHVRFTLAINNILNTYPDELDPGTDPGTDFAGRFKYPFDTTQFGIDGTRVTTSFNILF